MRNSRFVKHAIFAAVVTAVLLFPSGAAAKGMKANPVGSWFCTVVNPLIPTENLLLTINADKTLSMTSTISFIGLSIPDTFFLATGHGTWERKSWRTIATTTYFFVFSGLTASTPGYLQFTLAIPCSLRNFGDELRGTCMVNIIAPDDPDKDGVPNSPYPPTADPIMSEESDVTCTRLPVMKMSPQ